VVEVHVLQGERELAKYNRSLAKFDLVGITPAPRGVPQIEVTFDIDANGIVSVSARDKVSGKEQAIKITPSTGLSKEEIEHMIMEAKQSAASDRKLREMTELRNRIQGHAAYVGKSYSQFGWLLAAQDQNLVRDVLQRARDLSSAGENFQELKKLMIQLEDGASKLASAMLGSSSAQAGDELTSTPDDMQRLVDAAFRNPGPHEPE
jgi:molecular chaperone DnaK